MQEEPASGREPIASDALNDSEESSARMSSEVTDGDGEADTCRICSAPAEPDQPLFHPCKCSGTIRYIHQDCLTTWLAHSKKKTCDVCKHPYAFTKVYAEDMPSRLPVILLLRRLAQQTIYLILLGFRAVLVAFVWLAVLPWITVWTWRMYFAMGNSAAWWISARPRPASAGPSFFFLTRNISNSTDETFFNGTFTDNSTISNTEPISLVTVMLRHPLVRTVSADIFTGQIIATLIVLVFIAVFLLREWISQNARPGLFEDAEFPADGEQVGERDHEDVERLREHLMGADHGERERRLQQARDALEEIQRQREAGGHEDIPRRPLEPGQLPYPDRPMKDLPTRRSKAKQPAPDDEALPSASTSAGVPAATDTSRDVVSEKRPPVPNEPLSPSAFFFTPEEMAERAKRDSKGKGNAVNKSSTNVMFEKKPLPPSAFFFTPEELAERAKRDDKGKGKVKPFFTPPDIGPNQPRIFSRPLKSTGELTADAFEDMQRLEEFEQKEMKRLAIPVIKDAGLSLEVLAHEALLRKLRDEANAESMARTGRPAKGYRQPAFRPTNPFAVRQHFEALDRQKRARRRLLYQSLRDEAEAKGVEPPSIPPDLLDAHEKDDVTPPPAPKMATMPLPSPEQRNYPIPVFRNEVADRLFASKPDSPLPYPIASGSSSASSSPLPPSASASSSASFSFMQNGAVADRLFASKPESSLPHPISPSPASSLSPPASASSHPSRIPVPRRPPMPSATLPTPTTPPAPLRSKDHTPLASPSLATYRPPEEFQEGSSRQGYFDPVVEEDDADETLAEEHARFFRDPADRKAEDVEEGEDDGDDAEDIMLNLDLEGDADAEDEDAEEVPEGVPGLESESEDEDQVENGDAAPEVRDEDDQAEGAQRDGEAGEAQEQGGEGRAQGEQGADGAAPLAGGELDDVDINVEDDMEGALEAIGMRGPLFAIMQNAALMIFVLDTAIAACIWAPYTLGKSAALLSLDPRRILQIMHWPIRCMRYITDPFVDTIIILFTRLFFPGLFRIIITLVIAFGRLTGTALEPMLGREKLDYVSQLMTSTGKKAVVRGLAYYYTLRSPATEPANTVPNLIARVLESDHPVIRSAEPYFAALGKEVRVSSENLKSTWIRFALGDGTAEKVFAIAIGYYILGLLVLLYLRVITVGTVKNTARAIRNGVRQQMLVFKVGAFIIIELVIFPLGCGINLDLCSIWMFPEATLWSRIAFFKYAPLTAIFYHWVAGTMFMYQFAILLAGGRSIMRPGAMWFIKDPSDQNFHPIRDILDRPAMVQLRKLSVSALMYGIVVACGVWSVGSLMCLGGSTILPFRWKPREPLSNVPVDLLFLHVVLPYTVRFFKPRKMIRLVTTEIWRYLCGRLRLTSYMFGERVPSEEVAQKHWTWAPTDNVVLPRDLRATAEVDADGEAKDDDSRQIIAAQNAEAEKAKRNWKDDFIVVYIPPNFRQRLVAFMTALWVIGTVFIAVLLAAPIHLGRNIFKMFTDREIHDGYSFLAGFYVLWACWISGYAVERMERRRQRRGGEEPRADWPLYFLKRSALWLAKITYMSVFLGVVIPILFALVVELYIVLPIRFLVTPTMVPHIRIVDMWALGVIYVKIALRVHRVRPNRRLAAGIFFIRTLGWTNPRPLTATKLVIAPVIAWLLGMLFGPALVVLGLQRWFHLQLDGKFIFMHVYPGIFAVAGFARMMMTVYGILFSWSQSIRDKEFLVEMRLRNYEQEAKEKKEKKEIEAKEKEKEKKDAVVVAPA
ncbi:hypothetical protein EWM64_g363 [Hericium alpestre]|uniref:RING-type E3 ubiquitin transferase n=1 Tax=Hericium alpestre TaxID=135208 RepID=A0A4Z0AA96_9AGAM|nr:hypothetical protein EWM64_g363 [Hericium alpestre]